MNNQHNVSQFSVEEPPTPKKQPNGYLNRGVRKDKYDAINFCIAHAGQWCKLFIYEYKDGHNLIDGVTVEWDSRDKESARAKAYHGCWQRKQKLLQFAKELGVEIEFYFYKDWEDKVYTLYALVKLDIDEND